MERRGRLGPKNLAALGTLDALRLRHAGHSGVERLVVVLRQLLGARDGPLGVREDVVHCGLEACVLGCADRPYMSVQAGEAKNGVVGWCSQSMRSAANPIERSVSLSDIVDVVMRVCDVKREDCVVLLLVSVDRPSPSTRTSVIGVHRGDPVISVQPPLYTSMLYT